MDWVDEGRGIEEEVESSIDEKFSREEEEDLNLEGEKFILECERESWRGWVRIEVWESFHGSDPEGVKPTSDGSGGGGEEEDTGFSAKESIFPIIKF